MNPAALIALMWFYIGNGKGDKNMVVLPYKDRLNQFSKYLQQLVMESLGKEFDLDGNRVNQGLLVFGNKGSTDQHSYVQQLIDGINNFFVTFIEVLNDRRLQSTMVEENVTSGDYLVSFLHGTRNALYGNDRESITLTITRLSPFTIGALIALFERAVGFYAMLIHVNAYNQPGVEAGKKAAVRVIDLQLRIFSFLFANRGKAMTVSQIVDGTNAVGEDEAVFKTCEHLVANPDRGLKKMPGRNPFEATYQIG
jgi:glucose-6-phosphate isomerase